jgi:hypothetical protein
MSVIAASIPILRAFIRREAPKSQSIQFVQFSHIPEPSTHGRSVASVSDSKRYSHDGLVKHASRPSQTSFGR